MKGRLRETRGFASHRIAPPSLAHDGWAPILGGSLSILFGLLLVAIPAPAGLLSLLWLIGAYAVAFGVLPIVPAFRVRNHPDTEAWRNPACAEDRRS